VGSRARVLRCAPLVVHPCRDGGNTFTPERYRLEPYMGNTRNEEQNTRILFRFGLFCEYSNLEYVRIHAIYRVNQAGYAIHIPADAPPEYVNMYYPRRVRRHCAPLCSTPVVAKTAAFAPLSYVSAASSSQTFTIQWGHDHTRTGN